MLGRAHQPRATPVLQGTIHPTPPLPTTRRGETKSLPDAGCGMECAAGCRNCRASPSPLAPWPRGSRCVHSSLPCVLQLPLLGFSTIMHMLAAGHRPYMHLCTYSVEPELQTQKACCLLNLNPPSTPPTWPLRTAHAGGQTGAQNPGGARDWRAWTWTWACRGKHAARVSRHVCCEHGGHALSVVAA